LYKTREQEGKTGPVEELVPVEVRDKRKGFKRVNVVEILFTDVCK
jgi:hypothetical protein